MAKPVRPAAIPISAMVLTYNSGRTLGAVLRSLDFCDELVVVDSGSTDDSLAIAKSHGCRIFERPLQGFGEQKDFGVRQARHDWVFVVDSDEIVSEELRQEIRTELSRPGLAPGAYAVPIRLYFLGHPIRYSGQQSKRAVRLFHRGCARFDGALVHESVVTDRAPLALASPLLHYSYLTIEDYFIKFNRYTTLGAEALAQRPRRGRRLKVICSFPVQFFKFYFLKGGVADGYPGFLWCLLSALYPVIKYAKYEELAAARGVAEAVIAVTPGMLP